MILHSSSNSSINSTTVLCQQFFAWDVSLLQLAIFACMHFARKLVIFHFNSWLSFQCVVYYRDYDHCQQDCQLNITAAILLITLKSWWTFWWHHTYITVFGGYIFLLLILVIHPHVQNDLLCLVAHCTLHSYSASRRDKLTLILICTHNPTSQDYC